VRFYLGEEPLLRSVRTYDPCDEARRTEILDRIDELVVKQWLRRPRRSGGAKDTRVMA
jgi:uncharacterized circularly permuted ATP-grasp superfamily protein